MVASPLRYPGGKAKLFPYFAELIRTNKLFGAEYCEPYAGGAGLAIKLLTNGFVDRIWINDIDQSICAFWSSALFDTERFCRLIQKTPIDIDQWHRQQEIWEKADFDDKLKLGFAAYFLNRTNRSGTEPAPHIIRTRIRMGTSLISMKLLGLLAHLKFRTANVGTPE